MRICLLILISLLSACSSLELETAGKERLPVTPSADETSIDKVTRDKELFCSNEWFHYVEGQLHTSDQQGHGPDLGSLEWQSVVEFKLNLLNKSGLPKKSTSQWCEYIQKQLDARRELPSCQDRTLNTLEKMICDQPDIAKLDAELAAIFKSALSKSMSEYTPILKAEQKSWIKDRNKCLKSEDYHSCLQDSYQYRIAELQVHYDLLDGIGPIFYVCDDRPSDEIIVKFYPTRPASLMAERGMEASFMIQQESASGALYQGRNERFWEHHGEAIVTWGSNTEEMNCVKMH